MDDGKDDIGSVKVGGVKVGKGKSSVTKFSSSAIFDD